MQNVTPKQQGFFMPAEWERHQSTWLAWPYDEITFPGRIEKVEKVYSLIISYLHKAELVELLVLDEPMKKRVEGLLKACDVDLGKINFHIVDYADIWIRDYGPTFLIDGGGNTVWTKWIYNAYGKKFVDLLKDDEVFYHLTGYINTPMFEPGIVMEGGAVDVNGAGIALTTKECLLNENRNSHLTAQQTDECLKNYLGLEKIIWLENGIANDHTDGHIDEIARFVDKNTIVIAYEDDAADLNYKTLRDNLSILQDATDQDGNPFNIVKLRMPKMHYDDGERAPVSYANFYIANNLVLVPQFNCKEDMQAVEIIQSLFPDRNIVGVDSTDLVYGGGSIHCITQQQVE